MDQSIQTILNLILRIEALRTIGEVFRTLMLFNAILHYVHMVSPEILCSKSNVTFLGYLDPVNILLNSENTYFAG